MYFATRSERDGAPALIWPVPIATTKSAMVVSSVSPERWLTIAAQPAPRASSMAPIVSDSVPIWLSLISTAFVARSSIALPMNAGFVTTTSSPTSWTFEPSRAVMLAPARPVVLAEAVLDRDDRIAGDPVRPEVDQLAALERPTLLREAVPAGHALVRPCPRR